MASLRSQATGSVDIMLVNPCVAFSRCSAAGAVLEQHGKLGSGDVGRLRESGNKCVARLEPFQVLYAQVASVVLEQQISMHLHYGLRVPCLPVTGDSLQCFPT